jgi:excinuclease ABC subunit C
MLDDIPGVGPATRKKLLRAFGSVRGIGQASRPEIAKVVGDKKAEMLKKVLQ